MGQRAKDKSAMTRLYTQNGVSLIAAIFIIVILAFMGVMFVSLIGTGSFTSVNDMQSAQALYVAEGGLENATLLLNTSTLANRITCAQVSANLNTITLGAGQFSVTVPNGPNLPFYSTTAVTLSDVGGINNLITTINVNADPLTQGYASSGRIMIDRELIDYSGTLANSFVGAVRGRDGTIAASHANGARVGQYQCGVTSAGGIPDLATPRAQRAVREGVQLQEGWAVGNNGVILRWNGTGWTLFATTGTRLNGISMDSYGNGWTVGNLVGGVAQIRRWNQDGTPAWDAVGYPAITNDALLNAVHSISHNEAWAVGDDRATGDDTMIMHWTGVNWVYSDPAGNFDQNLNSIYVLDAVGNDGIADDGWAVGNNGSIRRGMAWGGFASPTGQQLNSVFLVSAIEGWIVGSPAGAGTNQWTFLRWNGAAWNLFAVNTGVAAQNLNSVFCVDANDCWAVGNRRGCINPGPTILRWNGAAWTCPVGLPAAADQRLNSVFCVNRNDCWAVGNNGIILHWDGSAWAVVVSPTGQNLNSVYLIGPKQRPQAAWQEVVN